MKSPCSLALLFLLAACGRSSDAPAPAVPTEASVPEKTAAAEVPDAGSAVPDAADPNACDWSDHDEPAGDILFGSSLEEIAFELVDPGSEPRLVRRFRFDAGARRLELRHDVTMKTTGLTVQPPREELDLRLTIAPLGDTELSRVELHVLDARTSGEGSVDGPGGVGFEIIREEIARILARQGERYHVDVLPNGDVVPSTDQTDELFGLVQLWPIFPDVPIGRGSRWNGSGRLGVMEYRINYELARVDGERWTVKFQILARTDPYLDVIEGEPVESVLEAEAAGRLTGEFSGGITSATWLANERQSQTRCQDGRRVPGDGVALSHTWRLQPVK